MDAAVDARTDGASDAAVADGSDGDGGADSGDGGTVVEPIPCSVEAPTECPTPAPRYGDVAPIIKARCSSCHGANWTGQWPLDSYRHVVDWEDTIRDHLLACTMPPPDAGIPMTNEERMQILNWIRCDAPQ